MKLSDLITYADAVKPNAFTDAVKTMWINEVEGMVMADVMLIASADIQNYTYLYASTWTGAGITFPTKETMLLPIRSDFSIGGTVVIADLAENAVNNSATARKILDISGDGLTLTFAANSFTVGLTADSAGTLTFDGSATILLVSAPYDKLYRSYLCAMIDFANGDYDKYNNSMAMFNDNFRKFTQWFARNYRPADGTAVFKGYYISAYAIAVSHGYSGTEVEWLASLKGDKGSGNGITSVTRTDGDGSAGTTDTYTILFNDATTTTFTVVNGKNGTNGTDGTTPVKSVDYFDGTDGKGITSITRTSGDGSAGTTDTYTILFTDTTSTTFNVVNGADGTDGGVTVDTAITDGGTNPVTSNAIFDAFALKLSLSGGTMSGGAVGHIGTDYTTARFRNVILSTADPAVGDGANGDVWIKYTP